MIGVGEPLRRTTAPEEDLYPAWAPDGKYIAFLRFYGGELQGRHELYLIPALSGKERKLADAAYSGISWAPDSKTLAFSSASTTEEPSGVYLLSVETGERRKLTTASVSPLSYDVFPTFSPDGKNVAFLRYYSSSSLDIYVVPATGGTPKQLTFDKSDIRGLTWTADSRELVYTVNRELRRIPAAGGASERIPISGQNPSYPSISRQGNRLAYVNEYNDSNIYLYEGLGFAGKSAPGKFGEATLILPSNLEDTSPQFSPDGRWIVFVSFRNDGEDLWISDSDGKNPAQLTNLKSPTGTPRWSPDGRWIVFDSRSRGSADIYVISPDGGQPRAITTESSAETKPSWSSDGKWIYFNSNRSGKDQIWKIPAAGGAAQQVTKSGAFEGFEAPDGQTFYFSKGRRVYGIWSMPVAGGEEKPVPELGQAGYWRSWGVLKEGIYYITKEETKQQTIRFFSFATRRTSPLLAVDKEPLIWNPGLSLSADGRLLLYAQLDYVVDDILLLENFR